MSRPSDGRRQSGADAPGIPGASAAPATPATPDTSRPTLRTYRWLLGVYGRSSWLVALLCVLQAAMAAIGVGYALMMRGAIDAAVAHDRAAFIREATVFAIAIIMQIILRAANVLAAERARSAMDNRMRGHVFAGILEAPASRTQRHHSGELMNRLTSDVTVVSGAITSLVPSAVSMAIRVVGVVAVMVLIAPVLTAVFVAGGCVMAGASFLLRGWLKRLHKRVQEAEGRVRSFMQECLESLLVIQAFGVVRKVRAQADGLMGAHQRARMRRVGVTAFAGTGLAAAMNVGYLVGFVWCGFGILDGSLSYGTMMAVIQLIGQIQSPFAMIGGMFPQHAAMLASAERLMEVAEDGRAASLGTAQEGARGGGPSTAPLRGSAQDDKDGWASAQDDKGEVPVAPRERESVPVVLGGPAVSVVLSERESVPVVLSEGASAPKSKDLASAHQPVPESEPAFEAASAPAFADARDLYARMDAIRFDHVDFTYGRNEVLHDFSASIRRGDFVAVTGRSGIGKSTLMKLLLGAYEPQAGSMGVSVRAGSVGVNAGAGVNVTGLSGYIIIPPHAIPRGFFAYVPQGNALMSGTIREAVAFADPSPNPDDIDDALVRESCRIADAASFVEALPEGYRTRLGERGAGLSEGQMQRIAVARALYSGAPVLLLDESTSALDVATEHAMLERIRALRDRTVLIVTHRAEVLEYCDAVVTLGAS